MSEADKNPPAESKPESDLSKTQPRKQPLPNKHRAGHRDPDYRTNKPSPQTR